MEYQALKKRVFSMLQIGNRSDIPSRLFDIGIAATIIINITVMIMLTFSEFNPWMPILKNIEFITIIIFCIEYALRIWTAEFLFPDVSPARAKWLFIKSFDGIIELLTILPFFFLSGFVAFRMLRVVRIFHLFRINAQYDSFNVIKTVLYEKRNQIFSSVFIILILVLASSLFMYHAEHGAQPNVFRNAFSAIWWSVSTLLTVGYGDIYPVTAIGKAMAIVIAFLGVGAVALPTGIISAGFVEQYAAMAGKTDDQEIHLHTMVVDIDSNWIGKTIHDIEDESGAIIVVVRRDGKRILPDSDYHVKMGDVLAVSRLEDE